MRHTDADCKNPEVLFQFTHPGKGATEDWESEWCRVDVSIHAPWEGCDASVIAQNKFIDEFQFTHPGKGATTAYLNANVS